MKELEKEINDLKSRNKKVELDKSWEESWTRRIIIFVLTYIVIAVYFVFANIDKPFLNAIVPAIAFMLSTLTLPWFKKVWISRTQPLQFTKKRS